MIVMKLFACIFLIYQTLANLVLINKDVTHPNLYRQYKEQLQLYRITNKVIEKKIKISNIYYWCYLPIVNTLIPSPHINITQVKFEEAQKYLQPLIGMCANYRTREFIYSFCYGDQVRQLDDEITIANMVKPQSENFLLGKRQIKIQKQQLDQSQQDQQSYIYMNNGIGRFPFKVSLKIGSYSLMKTSCININNQNIELKIKWIGSNDFLIVNNFKKECIANDLSLTSLQQQTLTKSQKQEQINILLSKPISSQLLYITSNKVEILTPQFISDEYVRFNYSHDIKNQVKSVPLIKGTQILKQKYNLQQLNNQKQIGQQFLFITTENHFRAIVKSVNPLKIDKSIKINMDKLISAFKIQQKTFSSITLPKINQFILFQRIQAGDSLINLDSNQIIQIISLSQDGIIILTTQDGWSYHLRSNGRSFRSKIYESNYSKQIEMENEYYTNKTANGFMINQGIWGIEDYGSYHFMRLPIQGKYNISSNIPFFVRYYKQTNIDSYKYKKRTTEMIFPQSGLKTSQKFFEGDACSDRLNRETTIIYKCANSWFQILQVSQKKVCSYQLIVGTRLLCPSKAAFNEEQDEDKETVCFNEKMKQLQI